MPHPRRGTTRDRGAQRGPAGRSELVDRVRSPPAGIASRSSARTAPGRPPATTASLSTTTLTPVYLVRLPERVAQRLLLDVRRHVVRARHAFEAGEGVDRGGEIQLAIRLGVVERPGAEGVAGERQSVSPLVVGTEGERAVGIAQERNTACIDLGDGRVQSGATPLAGVRSFFGQKQSPGGRSHRVVGLGPACFGQHARSPCRSTSRGSQYVERRN